MNFISVCNCGTLTISGLSASFTSLEGSYEEHITINGSPSWISTNKLYTVFYSAFLKNWIIGTLVTIGTRFSIYRGISDGEELCPIDVPSASWIRQETPGSSTSVAGSVTFECPASRNERKNLRQPVIQFKKPKFSYMHCSLRLWMCIVIINIFSFLGPEDPSGERTPLSTHLFL